MPAGGRAHLRLVSYQLGIGLEPSETVTGEKSPTCSSGRCAIVHGAHQFRAAAVAAAAIKHDVSIQLKSYRSRVKRGKLTRRQDFHMFLTVERWSVILLELMLLELLL